MGKAVCRKRVNIEVAMDFEKAKSIALERFVDINPIHSIPSWFGKCMIVSGTKKDSSNWSIEISIRKKEDLGENYSWEVVGGQRVLTVVDKKSGKKKVVIHRIGGDAVTVFRAKVNINTKEVNIEVNTDLSSLDENSYAVVE